MQKNSKALKRYYRAIRSWLPVSWRQKNQIITDLRGSIGAYLDAHPEADLQEIQTHFGSPTSIAAAYVDNTDTATLLRDLRIRKRVFTIVIATALSILLAVAGALAWEIVEYDADLNGRLTNSIVDEGATIVDP